MNDYIISSNFRRRLSECVTASGRSMTDAAARIGISKASMSLYLCGKRYPDTGVIMNLSAMFGVNPCWLAGYPNTDKDDAARSKNDAETDRLKRIYMALPYDRQEDVKDYVTMLWEKEKEKMKAETAESVS